MAGTFVKRAVALPGETWSLKKGVVFIDGQKLDEPYIERSVRGTDDVAARRVPANAYVMLGDNRAASCDSRAWGPVPREKLIGKVVAVYWPPNRISLSP